jgi:hypothetical protein
MRLNVILNASEESKDSSVTAFSQNDKNSEKIP